MKSANICSPPRKARHTHVEPGHELIAQTTPSGRDITAPDQGAVLLAASPGTADQINDVPLAFSFHAFVECSRVLVWVGVSYGHVGTSMVSIVLEVVHRILRFGLVEPEDFNAARIVVFASLLPYILSCGWVGGVEMDSVTLKFFVSSLGS